MLSNPMLLIIIFCFANTLAFSRDPHHLSKAYLASRGASGVARSTCLFSRGEGERLHKIISRSGYCSLRDAEALIREGRVTVNGAPVSSPGVKAVPHRDLVKVDGNTIFVPSAKDLFWVLYNKPKGISSLVSRKDAGLVGAGGGERGEEQQEEGSTDEQGGGRGEMARYSANPASVAGRPRGAPRVEEKIPDIRGLGFVAVSALPEWATGALLLTNDKAWVHKITHPSFGHFSRYLIGVEGDHLEAIVNLFSDSGGEGEDATLFDPNAMEYNKRTRRTTLDIQLLDASPRRLVARLAAAGVSALASLRRMSFGSADLRGLRPGQWRLLRASEVAGLKRMSSKLPM
jgi:23S rRNA pseudouridine2605 synthase